MPRSFAPLVEYLNLALRAQATYPQDAPQAVHALDALLDLATRLISEKGALVLAAHPDGIYLQGRSVEGAPNAAKTLADTLRARGIQGLRFRPGLDLDDLRLLFFILLLGPDRLEELGGAEAMMDGHALELVTDLEPPLPVAAPGPLPPLALQEELRVRLQEILTRHTRLLTTLTQGPWSGEQREALEAFGFRQADLASLTGLGDHLRLGHMDPATLRGSVRDALTPLAPLGKGAILLGLPTLATQETDLHRALDYLAPELLAEALVDAHSRVAECRPRLPLASAAMLQCVRERGVALEALKGRLMLSGWGMTDADALEAAVRWECQGTDTRLRQTLDRHGWHELQPRELSQLIHQLATASDQGDGLRRLLEDLRSGLTRPEDPRRRLALEALAGICTCLEAPGLPPGFDALLSDMLQGHLGEEVDHPSLQWACQGLETVLSHWLHTFRFDAVYRGMIALGHLARHDADHPDWKVQAMRDLLGRIASPPNLALLTPHLHHGDARLSIPQLHALLALMGRPAAQYLMVCLELEEDRTRRTHLLGALQAIGLGAVPALVEGLASPQWFLVRNALLLLEHLNFKATFPHVALALGHRDHRVQRAAIRAVVALGTPEAAIQALARPLEEGDPATQAACLAAMVHIRHASAVPRICYLVERLLGSTGEAAQVRLQAVTALGQLGDSAALPTLRDLFRLPEASTSREALPVRVAAARALGALKAREDLKTLLLQETETEVVTELRTHLG